MNLINEVQKAINTNTVNDKVQKCLERIVTGNLNNYLKFGPMDCIYMGYCPLKTDNGLCLIDEYNNEIMMYNSQLKGTD